MTQRRVASTYAPSASSARLPSSRPEVPKHWVLATTAPCSRATSATSARRRVFPTPAPPRTSARPRRLGLLQDLLRTVAEIGRRALLRRTRSDRRQLDRRQGCVCRAGVLRGTGRGLWWRAQGPPHCHCSPLPRSGTGGGLAAKPQQFSRRRRCSTRSGAPKSTGWCRPTRVKENPGPAYEQWSTPGNATASSRAWRGR